MPAARVYRGGNARRSAYYAPMSPCPGDARPGLRSEVHIGALLPANVTAQPRQPLLVVAPGARPAPAVVTVAGGNCTPSAFVCPQRKRSESRPRQIIASQVQHAPVPMGSAALRTVSAPRMVIVNGYPISYQPPSTPQGTHRCLSNARVRTAHSVSVVGDQAGSRSVTPRPPLHYAQGGQRSVNAAFAGKTTMHHPSRLGGSGRAPSRSCLLSQGSQSSLLSQDDHSQHTSSSWTPEIRSREPFLRPLEGSERLRSGSLHRPKSATSPTLPILAQRDEVSKAMEQLNGELIKSVQQDSGMQPAPLEDEGQAEDANSGAEDSGEGLQAMCAVEDTPTIRTNELAEAEGCGERVAALTAIEEESAVSRDVLIEVEDGGESVPALIGTVDAPTIRTEVTEAVDCEERVPTPTPTAEELAASMDGLNQAEDCEEPVLTMVDAEDEPKLCTIELSEAECCEERGQAPTPTDEESAASTDSLTTAEDGGANQPSALAHVSSSSTSSRSSSSSIPALGAAEDIHTTGTIQLTEAEDSVESVTSLAAIKEVPTISTMDMAEAYVLTQDSMPEFVEVQHYETQFSTIDSEEQSLASSLSLSGGNEDSPVVRKAVLSTNSDGFPSSWMRNASWSHSQTLTDTAVEQFRRTVTPRGSLRKGRTEDLEGNLSACRKALKQLNLERKEYDALTVQSSDQPVEDMHPLLEKASCLHSRLTDLAAESLECGCDRDVPGAMDVYEQANSMLDIVSDLLQDFTAASKQEGDEEETGDEAWPPLNNHTSDEMSTAPAFGLSRLLRMVRA